MIKKKNEHPAIFHAKLLISSLHSGAYRTRTGDLLRDRQAF